MRLMDSVPSRQDVQALKDSTRNLVTIINQCQQYLSQSQRQGSELIRRTASLEARLVQLEQELSQVHKVMNSVAAQSSQQRVMQRVIVSNAEEQERVQYGLTQTTYAP